MWATEGHPEHEGITGVTFDSDGHRLVGTLYLARGDEPKPTALLLHGCPGLDAVAAISPRPLLVVHGTDDRWIPAEQARELRDRARPPCRYVEVRGANHAFAWHRAGLRDLIAGWLDEACPATT
jgi:dipeptidyl aminopeptidase/acylaminoacyl peptidase